MAACQQSDTDEFIAVIPRRDAGHMKVVSMGHRSFAIRVCHGWLNALNALYECRKLFDV